MPIFIDGKKVYHPQYQRDPEYAKEKVPFGRSTEGVELMLTMGPL